MLFKIVTIPLWLLLCLVLAMRGDDFWTGVCIVLAIAGTWSIATTNLDEFKR